MEKSYHLEDIGVNKEIYRRARRHWSQSMPGVKINGKLSISLSHLPTNWSTFKFLSRKLCPFFLTAPLSHQFKSRKKKKKKEGETGSEFILFLFQHLSHPFLQIFDSCLFVNGKSWRRTDRFQNPVGVGNYLRFLTLHCLPSPAFSQEN